MEQIEWHFEIPGGNVLERKHLKDMQDVGIQKIINILAVLHYTNLHSNYLETSKYVLTNALIQNDPVILQFYTNLLDLINVNSLFTSFMKIDKRKIDIKTNNVFSF